MSFILRYIGVGKLKQKIIEAIKKHNKIIIHRHVRPDPDALGSQVGLKTMIQRTFPEKEVYAVGEEDPAYNFLTRMDEVDDSLFEQSLIIVCDTANTGRISDERYTMGKKIVKIDHHPNHDPYGDLNWVDTEASSTSELIYELYLFDKELWKIDAQFARLIYAGIIGDTGRFLFPSTRNITFRYAADLIEYDFDRTELYNGLYDIPENIAKLRGYVLQNMHISENGVTAIKLTSDILDGFSVEPIETSQIVGVVGDVIGVRAWVLFIEEDGLIRVRIRSKGPVINELAGKYNGGGHPRASGATVYSWAEADRLVEDLEELAKKY